MEREGVRERASGLRFKYGLALGMRKKRPALRGQNSSTKDEDEDDYSERDECEEGGRSFEGGLCPGGTFDSRPAIHCRFNPTNGPRPVGTPEIWAPA
jgi:hypothetical protein